MLKIHEYLASGRKPNCRTLASVFEVSSKTIQRDIDFMRDQLELPIIYDEVAHGFHYTKPVEKFPLLQLTQGEVVALLVAQKALEQYRGTPFESALAGAFGRLTELLPAPVSVSWNDLSAALSIRHGGVARPALRVFDVVTRALMEPQRLEFSYRKLSAEKEERRKVEPLHLACIDGQWYLFAHDLVRGATRTFVLTRMSRVKAGGKCSSQGRGFRLEEFLASSFAVSQGGMPENIKLRFHGAAARLVCERAWHRTQKCRPLRGGVVEMSLQVSPGPELERWILGWGGQVEVVAPRSLRESVRRQAQAFLVRNTMR